MKIYACVINNKIQNGFHIIVVRGESELDVVIHVCEACICEFVGYKDFDSEDNAICWIQSLPQSKDLIIKEIKLYGHC